MGVDLGPNKVNDGLVFGLDTGYGVADNSTTTRFYTGEPTTNVVTNTNLDTGWSKDYNTSIQTNDYPPPRGIDSQVYSFIDADGNGSGYWYSYNDYAPQDPSTTYTISLWVRTIGSDFALKAYTANNSEVGRQFTNTITIPGDGKWHRAVFNSITTPSNTQSDSLSFQFTTFPANQRVWICAPQMEVGSIATPFVDGTRSSTNSLIDLTKTTNIDVSNVSFDSTGQPTFDGTDDYLDLGSDITYKTSGGWTVESVVYYNSVAGSYNNITSPANFIGADSITYNSWYWSVLSNKLALWNISPGTWRYGSTTLQSNTWYHTALVSYDSGTSYQMYLNGVAEGGDHTTYTWNASYSGLKVRYIGRGNSSNTRLVNGQIPITKVYSRALSADEIQQNYNAYRKRFNL